MYIKLTVHCPSFSSVGVLSSCSLQWWLTSSSVCVPQLITTTNNQLVFWVWWCCLQGFFNLVHTVVNECLFYTNDMRYHKRMMYVWIGWVGCSSLFSSSLVWRSSNIIVALFYSNDFFKLVIHHVTCHALKKCERQHILFAWGDNDYNLPTETTTYYWSIQYKRLASKRLKIK